MHMIYYDYVCEEPYEPGGGLYSSGRDITCFFVKAYFLTPMFLNVFSRRHPSLEFYNRKIN